MYDRFPIASCTKREMLFDISPMWERPVVLDTADWTTAQTRFSILKRYNLLYDLFTSTPSFRSFMKNYAYFRCHGCVYVTITGTINHQGTLLAGVLPYLYNFDSVADKDAIINTLMTAPHSLLGANEATSSCIEIPFYVATDFLTMEAQNTGEPAIPDLNYDGRNPYANLVIMILNPLATAGGSSTQVSVHVQVKLTKLETYVHTPANPAFSNLVAESMLGRVITNTFDKTSELAKSTAVDFIDALRSITRQYTGLHNPNNPVLREPMFMSTRNRANIVDAPSYYEKMDPYSGFTRLTKDAIFHSTVDEMDMNFILSKPQYLGTFEVTSAMTAGTLLWVRPISPWQGGMYGSQALCSNIERLYYNTQAWSGDMELVIQSSMTNKQSLKLLVSKIYGLNRNCLDQRATYETARSGITSLLEFSAGNQQLTVDLDFLSRNQVLYNTVDNAANGLQHGLYYIYLAQPLVLADSVPTTVEFNVFLRCKKDFRFYGYSHRPGYTTTKKALGPYIPFPIALETVLEAESLEQPATSSATVMNEPSSGHELTVRDTSSVTPTQNVVERMYPISNLRDLIRRVQYIGRFSVQSDAAGAYSLAIPVTALAGFFPVGPSDASPNQNLMKMYGGHNLGVRLKIRCFDSANYFLQYLPPTMVSNWGTGGARDLLGNTVSSTSPYVSIVKGPVHGGPYMEMPTSWLADIKAQESGSVMDIHIPHTTMYNFWGGFTWSQDQGNVAFANLQSLQNNNGHIVISGINAPGAFTEFEVFMGVDDETRCGFHVGAPLLWLPITPTKTSYELPERVPTGGSNVPILLSKPVGMYYSNLTTSYNTPL